MNQNLRILFLNGFVSNPDNFAAGIFITRRLRELTNKGVNFRCISPIRKYFWPLRTAKTILKREIIDYPDHFSFDGVRVDYVPMEINSADYFQFNTFRPSLLVEKMSSALLKAIEGEQYDLVHAHCAYPYGAAAAKIGQDLGIPSVVTAHGSEIHSVPFQKKILRAPTVNALKKPQKTIFVSNALREKAMQLGFDGYNSVVIPNGVDTDVFKPMKKEEIRKELGIVHKCVGFVGNLIPIKRVDRLSQIFFEINQLVPGTVFLVVGEGYLRKQFTAECLRFGLDARFTGRIAPDKVPYFMNAMDVMLLPSRGEGWPCVALEAQACGVPVVGSSNGGIPEAIGHGGIVVPETKDFEVLFAKAAVTVLNSNMDTTELVERAKQHSWSEIVQREISVYQEVLSER